MSNSGRAVIVVGEAPESEDEDNLKRTTTTPTISSTEDGSRLSLAGLSLSSVTAQVGKQIGAISAGTGQNKTTQQTKIHHPTLLHKKLYDRNLIVNNNVKSFFKGLFDKSFEELSRINADCFNTSDYLQSSTEELHGAVQNCKQIEESLLRLCDSLDRTNLPTKSK
jgi:hypothetical protein